MIRGFRRNKLIQIGLLQRGGFMNHDVTRKKNKIQIREEMIVRLLAQSSNHILIPLILSTFVASKLHMLQRIKEKKI